MRKTLRTGRVLIDWSQNNGKKTTIAPYSLRGRPRPTVAAPRTWEELEDSGLRQLEASEVLERVAVMGDPMRAITERSHGGPLAQYLSMRSAAATPEPMPASAWGEASAGEPRFVIQEHRARRLHFDLRLERDGVLKSWAVPKGVPETSGTNHLAVQTEDHPMEYAVFEGTIPKGEYGAGSMTIWDAGTYATEKWRDDEIIIDVDGRPGGPLGGSVRLALIRTDGQGEKSSWLLHRMKDQSMHAEQVLPVEPVEAEPVEAEPVDSEPAGSTRSARPAHSTEARPMLATAATVGMLAGEDWALEWKWDGIRVLARVEAGGVRLLSRNGIDITDRYPELAQLPAVVRGDALLDGEIVALDADGRPDFGRLQHRMNLTRPREIERVAASVPVRLLLFDVLEVDGRAVVDEPYRERRARLAGLVRMKRGVPIEVPAPATGSPAEALEESRRLGLEGLVAKRPDSRYLPGARSGDWLKLKLTLTQEVVIGGYRRGVGTRTGRIRSLLVGIPGDGGLEYAGRVGSGIGERQLERLMTLLEPLEQAESPFVQVPAADMSDAVWVRPELVGEIELGDWTSTGVARHPRWRGLRPDKSPDEVVRES